MKEYRNIIIESMLIVLVLLIGGAAGAGVEIRLRRSAAISGENICLGDVAEVKAEQLETQKRLESLVITQSAQNSDNATVGRFEIIRALSRANIAPAGVDIYGASHCRLEFESTKRAETGDTEERADSPETKIAESDAGATLKDQLNEAFAQFSGLPLEKLKIEWYCNDLHFLHSGADQERFQIKPCSAATLGQVRFKVVDKQQTSDLSTVLAQRRVVPVRGRVQYLCESVVARRMLPVGHVITARDVKLMPRRVSSYRDIGVTDIKQFVGQETARSIPAHALIRPSMVRKVTLVKRNDLVNVCSRSSCIEITLKGKALGEGAYNDTITVSYGPNKTLVRGRVTGPGEVTIGEGAGDKGFRLAGTELNQVGIVSTQEN